MNSSATEIAHTAPRASRWPRRRSGRRPGPSGTRDAILAAAAPPVRRAGLRPHVDARHRRRGRRRPGPRRPLLRRQAAAVRRGRAAAIRPRARCCRSCSTVTATRSASGWRGFVAVARAREPRGPRAGARRRPRRGVGAGGRAHAPRVPARRAVDAAGPAARGGGRRAARDARRLADRRHGDGSPHRSRSSRWSRCPAMRSRRCSHRRCSAISRGICGDEIAEVRRPNVDSCGGSPHCRRRRDVPEAGRAPASRSTRPTSSASARYSAAGSTSSRGYGERFGFADDQLEPLVGGLRSRDELLAECDVVILPKPLADDLETLRPGQVVWGWPHSVRASRWRSSRSRTG